MKYIKVLGVFIVYILYFFLSKKAILFLLQKGFLDTFPDIFFDTIDIILYGLLTVFFCFLFKSYCKKNTLPEWHSFIFLIPIIVFLFRVIEDPLFNFKYIFEGAKIIVNNTSSEKNPGLIYLFIAIVFFAPFLEELVFRKIMLNILNKNITSILFSSFLFSLIHLFSTIELPTLLSTFLFGIILGFVYLKYGVFYSFLIHLAYNLLFFINRYYYYDSYVEILSKLDFNWIYWLIILGSLVILVRIVKWLYTSVFPRTHFTEKIDV